MNEDLGLLQRWVYLRFQGKVVDRGLVCEQLTPCSVVTVGNRFFFKGLKKNPITLHSAVAVVLKENHIPD